MPQSHWKHVDGWKGEGQRSTSSQGWVESALHDTARCPSDAWTLCRENTETKDPELQQYGLPWICYQQSSLNHCGVIIMLLWKEWVKRASKAFWSLSVLWLFKSEWITPVFCNLRVLRSVVSSLGCSESWLLFSYQPQTADFFFTFSLEMDVSSGKIYRDLRGLKTVQQKYGICRNCSLKEEKKTP